MINYSSEVQKMIASFHMEDFLKNNEEDQANGAFLLITNQQVILSYTENYGKGFHEEAIGKALCEIMGDDQCEDTMSYLLSVSKGYFLIARMINEPGLNYIIFEMRDLVSITPNQLILFEKFMEENNYLIEKFSKEAGRGTVLMEAGGKEFSFSNLRPVYEYLKTIVNEAKQVPGDVNIIGNITLDSHVESRRGER